MPVRSLFLPGPDRGADCPSGKKNELPLKYFTFCPIKIITRMMEHSGKEESDMRIEAYNQVQQLYQAKQAGKTQKSAAAGRTDRVQISSFGKDIQIAKAAVASAPDIRE